VKRIRYETPMQYSQGSRPYLRPS